MATGYFKLYRPLQGHWIYKDSRYLHLWIECLINARWSSETKTDVYKGVMYSLERGQFLFSRNTYSERLNIDEATVRRCIDLMLKDEMIEKVMSLGRNKPTIYQVTNFDKYNTPNEPSEYVENTRLEAHLNQVEAHSKPTGDPLETAKEECNNVNNEKENIYTQIFDFYIGQNIIKHTRINNDMKKAIDLAKKELGLDVEYFKRIIVRHKEKIETTKNTKYPIKKRPLAELFGQKKAGGVSLICADYLDEVSETKKDTKTYGVVPAEKIGSKQDFGFN